MSELGKPKELSGQGSGRSGIIYQSSSLKAAAVAGLALLVLLSVLLVLSGCIPTPETPQGLH